MRMPKLSVVLSALLLLAGTTACGSRLTDEERALVLSSGGGAGVEGGGEGVTDVTVETDATTDTLAAGPTGDGAAAGHLGGTGGRGGPCRAHRRRRRRLHGRGAPPAPGVTPTEITVGNVSQLTGLVPGFGQTGVNGAKAYFNMVNSQRRGVRPQDQAGRGRRPVPVGDQPLRDREDGRPGRSPSSATPRSSTTAARR